MAPRNTDWSLTPDHGAVYSWNSVKVALLMDIRDEIKALRRVFECDNFLGMPAVLRQVRANTAKPKKRRKK